MSASTAARRSGVAAGRLHVPSPRVPRRQRPLDNWHATAKASLTRGDRAADILRNGMGSWRFVGLFLLFMVIWAIANTVVPRPWDAYPYILLNLFLSMLAGLQGAILLIAAKRQDGIAAALAQHDYETNRAAKEEIEELMRINREQLDLMRGVSTLAPRATEARRPVSSGARLEDVAALD